MSGAAFICILTSGYLTFTRRVTRRYVVSLHGCHSVKYRSGHSRHLFQYCSVIHLLDLSQILGQSFRFFVLQVTSRSNNVEGTLADVWQDVKICQSPSVSTCNSAANIYMRHCITRLSTQHNGHIHNDAETI